MESARTAVSRRMRGALNVRTGTMGASLGAVCLGCSIKSGARAQGRFVELLARLLRTIENRLVLVSSLSFGDSLSSSTSEELVELAK